MNEITADQVTKSKVTSEDCTWHRSAIELTAIVTLYLALAFFRLDGQSFWTDEALSLTERLRGPETYRISPLYYVLLGLWSTLTGTTEFALRAFSALLGTAAVCITYAIAHIWINRKTAVFGAILLATSPYFIWYAQEVRWISLTFATSLLMTYWFIRAISAGSWRIWLFYGASSLLALSSFVTVVLLVWAHGLFLLCCRSYRPLLRIWLPLQLLIQLVFVIWIGVQAGPELAAALTTTPSITADDLTRSGEYLPVLDVVGIIPYTFYAFSTGFSLGPSLRELHVTRSINTLVSYAPTLLPLALLFGTIIGLGLMKLWQNRNLRIFLLLWLSVPILGTYIVATTTTFHEYNTRYVAISLPAYILILATAIAGFRRYVTQLVLLGSLLVVNGASLANYYFDTEYAREDARSAAKYLQSSGQPGDLILLNGNAAAFQHYYRAGLPVVRVAGQITKEPSVVHVNGKLPEISKNHGFAWLVEIRPWETDPQSIVKATLDRLALLRTSKSFPGVDVFHYELGAAASK